MRYEKAIDAFKDSDFKFKIEEFVHPNIILSVGREKAIWFVSLFQVNYAALLRETLDAPVVINTYHTKQPIDPGYYLGRGTRPRFYKPKGGGELSMHYLAMALDVSSPAHTPQEIYRAIILKEARFKEIGLTTIEDLKSTPGWLHGDGRQQTEAAIKSPGFTIVNAPRQ